MSDDCATQYSTQIYEPQRIKQGRDLGEQFHTNPACFLDLLAESPVGVLVHWNASKTPIFRPAPVDRSVYCDYLHILQLTFLPSTFWQGPGTG